MKKPKLKIEIKIKKIYVHINIFSKYFLKRRGKVDGKKGIPFIVACTDISSPNIIKEHDKIYSYMAYVIKTIEIYNAENYHYLQAFIAELDSKIMKATKIYEFIKDKPHQLSFYIPKYKCDSEFEEFLNSRHALEKALDDMAIRQRRFDEYQNMLSKYNTNFESLCDEIDESFKSIMVYLNRIKRAFELCKPLFWRACFDIDIRLSWYWQGVLLKHAQANKLPSKTPVPDMNQFEKYIDLKMEELKKITETAQKKYHEFKELLQ